MNTNHIESINIKKFKCFEDFKVDGFKRVNLVAGKNNVGKTAFMEAHFLASNTFDMFTKRLYTDKFAIKDIEYVRNGIIDEDWYDFEFIKYLIIIKQNRERLGFFTQWIREEIDLTSFDSFNIEINNECKIFLSGRSLTQEYLPCSSRYKNDSGHLKRRSVDISKIEEHKYYYKIYKKNHPPIIKKPRIISICNEASIKIIVDELKLNGKYIQINNYLNKIFKIDQIDIIDNKVMLRQNRSYKNLAEFGDGIRHFINMILILLINKKTTVYLDEVDNGIHFSHFDSLWKIILKTSKKQNIQVFATTHSQECIESYNRVAKKLNDEEITFLELFLHKEKIKSMLLDNEMLDYQISQNHEVRG